MTEARVIRHPLSWYVDKMARGESYSSLLYGDGEFRAMFFAKDGEAISQYKDVVTPSLRRELIDSLSSAGADVLRGTDPHLIDWHLYEGGDKASVRSIGEGVQAGLAALGVPEPTWVDGTVWDRDVREGNLAPFLREVVKRPAVLVGHPALADFARRLSMNGAGCEFVPVRPANASGDLDALEAIIGGIPASKVYLLCMGLGAIPLIMRLRRQRPVAWYFDLGSVLDVFAGLGASRGWRQELYADPVRLKETIDRNLEGV